MHRCVVRRFLLAAQPLTQRRSEPFSPREVGHSPRSRWPHPLDNGPNSRTQAADGEQSSHARTASSPTTSAPPPPPPTPLPLLLLPTSVAQSSVRYNGVKTLHTRASTRTRTTTTTTGRRGGAPSEPPSPSDKIITRTASTRPHPQGVGGLLETRRQSP